MNFTFENQGTNTYLVYTIGENDVVDSMSLGMLTNNKIPGLATTLFTQMDATKYIKYNVSSKVSVSQFFMGPVNKKRLLGVFEGIVDAMLSAEDYMIDIQTIMLDLEYIFTDVSTCETVLICLPIEKAVETKKDLGTFFKNIMFSTQFDQTENCDHVAKIINYLNSTPVFSLVDFKRLLDDLNKALGAVAHIPQPAAAPVQNSQPMQSQTVQPNQAATQPQVQRPQMAANPQVTSSGQNYVSNAAPMQPQPSARPVAPQMQAAPQPVIQPNKQATPNAIPGAPAEKQMSMMNLLMHYNKENAQLYKEQKAAKKAAGSAAKAVPQPAKNVANNTGFNTPKQNVPVNNAGFAIPGQPTPAPGTMAVPSPKAATKASPQQAQKPAQPTPQTAPAMAAMPDRPPVQSQQGNVYPANAMPQMQNMNFGETTILGGGNIGETTVLGVSSMKTEVKPYLIRTKNNEKIPLDKPVFRIGKEKSYVDYFIGDNTAISRSHANIVSRDGEYFVVDTNSTNHTYVNGAMIASNVETKISSGAKIRLANEDFEFKLI